MDKSTYNMKAEKIQNQVKQGDYATAAEICETIDWTEVKSTRMLSLVSSIYEHVGQYEKASDILLMAYEESSRGKRFLYKLTELSLAGGHIKEAQECYKNYLEEAPDDNARFILRYKIAEARNESLEKKISILEAFKKQEFDNEEYMCKLAKLYEEAGRIDECVALCDDIILWFGVGPYVEKAIEIKEKHMALTKEQEAHRDNPEMFEENLRSVQREMSGDPEEVVPQVEIPDENTQSGQQVSAIDISIVEESADEVDEETPISSTRKVSDKEDFNHTRVFEKLPVDTSEMKLFNTIIPPRQEEPENASEEPVTEDEPKDEPAQMEFNWDEEEKTSVEKIVYISANAPSAAMNDAARAIKNGHDAEGTAQKGITKITAVKLNEKGLIRSLEVLAGKDLVILGASALSMKLIDEIKTVNASFAPDKFIVLADSPAGIETVKAKIDGSYVEEVQIVKETVEEEAQPAEEVSIEETPVEEAPAEEFVPEIAITIPEDIDEEENAESEEAEPESVEEAEEEIEEPVEEEEPEEEEKVEEIEENAGYEKYVETFFGEILDYMKSIDCVLQEGDEEKIKDHIVQLKNEGEVLDQKLAEELVEDAADAAEAHSLGNMFRSRYDADGNLVIKGKDFKW